MRETAAPSESISASDSLPGDQSLCGEERLSPGNRGASPSKAETKFKFIKLNNENTPTCLQRISKCYCNINCVYSPISEHVSWSHAPCLPCAHKATFRSPGEVLHSGSTFASRISQRQKERGTHERSVVSLHSVQGVPRRLQWFKVSLQRFSISFNPHRSNFTKLHIFGRDIIPADLFHHISLWLQAQLKSNLIPQSARELWSALYMQGFFGRYHLYICRFDWILKLSLNFEKLPNSDSIYKTKWTF